MTNTDTAITAGSAGAAILLAAPLVAIGAVAALPTVSDRGGDQVEALLNHRGAMIAGMTLQTISISLLIGGAIWLAYTLRGRGGRVATVGGVLAVAGSLITLFEDGVSATGPAIVGLLDPTRAAVLIDRIHSGAIAAVEPLSLVADLGLALLGVAAVKAGAPRWSAVAVAVGAFAEGAGFGSSTRPLILAGFGALVIGLGQVVRHLFSAPAGQRVNAAAFA